MKRLDFERKSVIRTVPFYRMKFTKSEIDAVARVLRSGWLTTGEISKRFERRFAQYQHTKFAAAVSSCTAGLFLSLKALNLKAGDEVITTPYTFVASVEAIIHTGARPVFADIDPLTLNLDPDSVEARISSRTKAIVPVHIAGLPCRMDKFRKIAQRHDLFLVSDCAHAIGASFKGKPVGSLGEICSFSFYATKNLTTGEGGMVTTNDRHLAEQVQILSLHGMDKQAWRRYLDRGHWYYEVVNLGYKYNLADLNAALGLAMMDRLEKLQSRRRQVAGWYDQALGKFEEIELPRQEVDSVHAWHLYIIKLNLQRLSITRDEFIEKITAYGIGTGVHFIPLFLQPYYRGKYGLSAKSFPEAKRAFERVITLPFYPDLSKAEVNYVAGCIGKTLARYRKYEQIP